MKNFRTLAAGLVAVIIGAALLFTACPQPEETKIPKMNPGVYTGTFSGFEVMTGAAQPTTIFVEVGAFQITDISWRVSLDSPSVGQQAAPVMVDKILKAQNVEVDNVAGASITSAGLKAAVKEALGKAGAPGEFTSKPRDLPDAEKGLISEDVDILIIGSGIAGLSAAKKASADKPNAKIVLIEKQEIIGGSTKLSAGVVYGALDDGGADSTLLATYYKDRGQNNVDNTLVEFWANNSFNTLIFLGYSTGPGSGSGTAAEGRMRMGYNGNGLVQKLVSEVPKVDIRTGIKATELITNQSGAVIGVKAESKTTKYTFNTTYTAMGFLGPTTVNGAVIIATGGFDSDHNGLMTTYNSDSAADIPQSSWENKGDGIKLAQAIGADMVFKGGKIGWVGIDPSLGEASHYYSAVIKGDGTLLALTAPSSAVAGTNNAGIPHPALTAVTSYTTHVDDYAVVHRRMLDARKANPNETFWAITNTPANEVYKAKGFAFQAESPAALAALIGVNAVNLQAAFASGQAISSMFGPSSNLTTTGTVFTATKAIPSSIGSMGGIKINVDAAVLKNNIAIPGLYAAGETANGQFFYLEYPGSGSSLSISATMGRTAGAKAAAGL